MDSYKLFDMDPLIKPCDIYPFCQFWNIVNAPSADCFGELGQEYRKDTKCQF